MIVFCVFGLGMSHSATAQPLVSGVVTDEETKEALIGASVSLVGTGQGVQSDENGRFSIAVGNYPSALQISYLGYRTRQISFKEAPTGVISLTLQAFANDLKEVEISAKNNPAYRIIRAAGAAQEKHNPASLPAYYCQMYSRLLVSASKAKRIDSSAVGVGSAAFDLGDVSNTNDTSLRNLSKHLDSAYLFVAESVKERRWRAPELLNEKFLASRVSGLKNDMLLASMTQLQSFDFYGQTVDVGGRSYPSPIAKDAVGKYEYHLMDTTFEENGAKTDTVYWIYFYTPKAANFSGLKGMLAIVSGEWAVKEVIAYPAKNPTLKLQQNFKRLPNGRWFADELRAEIPMGNVSFSKGVSPLAIGYTKLLGVTTDTMLERKAFGPVVLEFATRGKNDQSLLDRSRTEPLNAKATNTYQFMDSLVAKEAPNAELWLSLLPVLSTGRIPLFKGRLLVPFERIVAFNPVEGPRLGAGLETGPRISQRWSLGGWYGYGFKDKQPKYSAYGKYLLVPRRELAVHAGYAQDLRAIGTFDANPTGAKGFSQNAYALIAPLMDYQERYSVGVSASRLRYLMLDFTAFQSRHNPSYDYYEKTSTDGSDETSALNRLFTRQAAEFKIRYAKGEKVSESLFGTRKVPGKWPIMTAVFEQGMLQRANGVENLYGRAQLALEKQFKFRWGGSLELFGLVEGVSRRVPFSLLGLPRGTNIGELYFADPKTFQTLGPQSLLATQFAATFARYVFKPLYMRKKADLPGPTPAIRAAAGWGKLASAGRHTELGERGAFRAPFYEVGVEIARLVNLSGIGYGIGAYTRVGNYITRDNKQDIAIKLLLDLPF